MKKLEFRNAIIAVLVIVIVILFIPLVKKQTTTATPSVPSANQPGNPAPAVKECVFDSECVSAGKGDKCDNGICRYRAPPGGECSVDADCRPSTCCHSSTCVTVGKEPNCNDVVCTQECKPATMDCGQGKCQCINSKCLGVVY